MYTHLLTDPNVQLDTMKRVIGTDLDPLVPDVTVRSSET